MGVAGSHYMKVSADDGTQVAVRKTAIKGVCTRLAYVLEDDYEWEDDQPDVVRSGIEDGDMLRLVIDFLHDYETNVTSLSRDAREALIAHHYAALSNAEWMQKYCVHTRADGAMDMDKTNNMIGVAKHMGIAPLLMCCCFKAADALREQRSR